MAASGDAIKAGKAFVEISADDKKFHVSIDRIIKRFASLGAFLRNTGKQFALAGAAVLVPLGASFLAAVKHADKIQDIADRMNTTTEAVSRLGYAADQSASSLEDVEASNRVLTRSAIAASQGSKDQADAFDKMSISASEFLSMEVDERFVRIAEALDGMDDPLERSKFLMALLGKQAAQALPLLKEGAEGLRALFNEAEKTGSVLRGEDAKRAAAVADLLDKSWREVKNTVFEVGLTFLGFTQDLTESSDSFSKTLKNIREWIRDNRRLIFTITALAAGLVVVGVTLFTLGVAIGVIVTAAEAFVAVLKVLRTVAAITWAVVTGPAVIFVAAIASVIAIVLALAGKLDSAFSGVGDTFRSIGNTFGKMFGGIVAAIKKGDWLSAWKILQYGMYAIFLDVVALLRGKWNDFVNYFRDAFRDVAVSIQKFFLDMIRGIQQTLLDGVLFIVNTVNSVSSTITSILGGEPKPQTEAELKRRQRVRTDAKQIPEDIAGVSKKLAEQKKILDSFAGMSDEQIFNKNPVTRQAWLDFSGAKEKTGEYNKELENLKKKLERVNKELEVINKNPNANLIDTGALEQAKKDIDIDIDARQKGIEDADKLERERRNKAQQERIDGILKERDMYKKMIEELTHELNKVEPNNALPVAPFPRVKGARSIEDSLGDSVRGLFQSADFQGALGLGPANSYAKQQLDTQQAIVTEIKGLRTDIQNNPGALWG